MTMTNPASPLNPYATLMGTYMGIFWVAKFALVPLGMESPFLIFFYCGLTLCVPYVAFCMARSYRDRVLGGVISFGKAWGFLFQLFIYASLLSAFCIYLYFRFIDGGYLLNGLEERTREFLQLMTLEEKAELKPQLELIIESLRSRTPIVIAMEQITQDITLGAIGALLVAPFVRKWK